MITNYIEESINGILDEKLAKYKKLMDERKFTVDDIEDLMRSCIIDVSTIDNTIESADDVDIFKEHVVPRIKRELVDYFKTFPGFEKIGSLELKDIFLGNVLQNEEEDARIALYYRDDYYGVDLRGYNDESCVLGNVKSTYEFENLKYVIGNFEGSCSEIKAVGRNFKPDFISYLGCLEQVGGDFTVKDCACEISSLDPKPSNNSDEAQKLHIGGNVYYYPLKTDSYNHRTDGIILLGDNVTVDGKIYYNGEEIDRNEMQDIYGKENGGRGLSGTDLGKAGANNGMLNNPEDITEFLQRLYDGVEPDEFGEFYNN